MATAEKSGAVSLAFCCSFLASRWMLYRSWILCYGILSMVIVVKGHGQTYRIIVAGSYKPIVGIT